MAAKAMIFFRVIARIAEDSVQMDMLRSLNHGIRKLNVIVSRTFGRKDSSP